MPRKFITFESEDTLYTASRLLMDISKNAQEKLKKHPIIMPHRNFAQ